MEGIRTSGKSEGKRRRASETVDEHSVSGTFCRGEAEKLEPFSDTVDERFTLWMTQQQMSGRTFTQEQVEWLIMIKDHITASLTIEMDDFDDVPFNQKGGVYRVYQVFREELNSIIGELNAVLAV